MKKNFELTSITEKNNQPIRLKPSGDIQIFFGCVTFGPPCIIEMFHSSDVNATDKKKYYSQTKNAPEKYTKHQEYRRNSNQEIFSKLAYD